MTPTRPSPTHTPDRDTSTAGRERRTLHDDAVTPFAIVSAPLVMRSAPGAANESALLALQRSHGNAHVSRLVTGIIQRQPATKVISIGSEQVIVASDAEKTEAEAIFKEVREKYGIRMSSSSGITAIDTDYDKVPDSVKKQLKTTAWKMEELRALSRALVHFSPILGKERASSTRSGDKQEAASVSKLEQGIDKKTAKFTKKLKAQQFDTLRNVTLYSSLTDFPADFKGDRVREIEGIIIHELAHGLLDYAVDNYLKNLPYWKDASTKSGKAGAEAPITEYGSENIDEDLGEAVRFYFLAPQKLKDGTGAPAGKPGNPCRKRFELIDGYVKAWKRTPPKTP